MASRKNLLIDFGIWYCWGSGAFIDFLNLSCKDYNLSYLSVLWLTSLCRSFGDKQFVNIIRFFSSMKYLIDFFNLHFLKLNSTFYRILTKKIRLMTMLVQTLLTIMRWRVTRTRKGKLAETNHFQHESCDNWDCKLLV